MRARRVRLPSAPFRVQCMPHSFSVAPTEETLHYPHRGPSRGRHDYPRASAQRGIPLPVAWHACSQGGLEPLLQPPDGSRRFVPAEWTVAGDRSHLSRRIPVWHRWLATHAHHRRCFATAAPSRRGEARCPHAIHSEAALATSLPSARPRRSGLGKPQRDSPECRAGRSSAENRTRGGRERGGTGARAYREQLDIGSQSALPSYSAAIF